MLFPTAATKKQELVLHRHGSGNEAQPLLLAACRAEPLSLGGKTKAVARNHRQFKSHRALCQIKLSSETMKAITLAVFKQGATWMSEACEGICHQEVQTAEIPVATLLT